MNKEQFKTILFQTLQFTGLAPQDVVIGAGGACLMFGIRTETNDIDVSVNKEIFESLRGRGFTETEYLGCPIIKLNAWVDAHLENRKYESVIIEGVHCQSVFEVLRFKEFLNRPKDQEDIKALRNLFNNKCSLWHDI